MKDLQDGLYDGFRLACTRRAGDQVWYSSTMVRYGSHRPLIRTQHASANKPGSY